MVNRPFNDSTIQRFNHFTPVLLSILALAPSAQACAVCFGNSDSKMTQGMLAGVLVLLLVVLGVLGGFAALFIHLARRAGAVAALEAEREGKES